MTEDQIERRVERMTDHLDELLLTGQMTQKNYDLAMGDLNTWAEAEYARAEIWGRVRRRVWGDK